MSDLSDFAAAFAELKRTVQPDTDPVLTYGDGVTPDASMDLDAILLAARVATTWAAATAYAYGQIVLPTTRNGRRYRVTQAGTSGATEPTWPAVDYGVVTNGSSSPALTFEEAGMFTGNVYDVREAVKRCLRTKRAKALHYFDLGDARMGQIADRLAEEVKAYGSVGVA